MPIHPRRIVPGQTISPLRLDTVMGKQVDVPDGRGLVHLQFRRFAGCPVCSLHLHSIVSSLDKIEAVGVREVVVFHASATELRAHTSGLPFAVVPDPKKFLYAQFGVESAPWALLNPRVWPWIVLGVARAIVAIVLRKQSAPSLRPEGGRLGLPADFLIANDGRVVAVKYGVHAYDQWSVDELLALAQGAVTSPGRVPMRAFQP